MTPKTAIAALGVTTVVAIIVLLAVIWEARRDSGDMPEERAELISDLRRLVTEEGLARYPESPNPATPDESVSAAFAIARISGPDIATGENALSTSTLRNYANDETHPLPRRLEAHAAVRLLEDAADDEALRLARDAMEKQPDTVTRADLPDYLDIALPATLIDQSVDHAALREFPATTDDVERRFATVAIAHHFLFRNEEEVRTGMFPELRPDIARWATGNAPHLSQELLAYQAYINYESATPRDRENIRDLTGCAGFRRLVPVERGAGMCSLANTLHAVFTGVYP